MLSQSRALYWYPCGCTAPSRKQTATQSPSSLSKIPLYARLSTARTSTKIDHVVLSYDTANPEQEWGEGKIPYGASSTYLGKSATLDRTDGHACNAATGNIVQPAGKKFPTRHGERVRDEGRKKGKLIL